MNKLIPIAFVVALAPLAACDETTAGTSTRPSIVSAALSIPAEPIGAKGKAAGEVYDADGKLIDPNADSDGDGISNAEELTGWPLTLDPDGWTVFLDAGIPATATSDPRFADSDGDGLTDGEERAAQADPRKHDTDGDGLSDLEEVRRFGTNPSRVDSDGDARAAIPRTRGRPSRLCSTRPSCASRPCCPTGRTPTAAVARASAPPTRRSPTPTATA